MFDTFALHVQVWNFDWSINVNFDGMSDYKLNELFFLLELDGDSSPQIDATDKFDPINGPLDMPQGARSDKMALRLNKIAAKAQK